MRSRRLVKSVCDRANLEGVGRLEIVCSIVSVYSDLAGYKRVCATTQVRRECVRSGKFRENVCDHGKSACVCNHAGLESMCALKRLYCNNASSETVLNKRRLKRRGSHSNIFFLSLPLPLPSLDFNY
mgnify:CR=1 FL=1